VIAETGRGGGGAGDKANHGRTLVPQVTLHHDFPQAHTKMAGGDKEETIPGGWKDRSRKEVKSDERKEGRKEEGRKRPRGFSSFFLFVCLFVCLFVFLPFRHTHTHKPRMEIRI